MAPGGRERGHLPEEATEEQSLMGGADQQEEEEAPAPDAKVRVERKRERTTVFPVSLP